MNPLQHKSLLLFLDKKVIVAKIKLCCAGVGKHKKPPRKITFSQYNISHLEMQDKLTKKYDFYRKQGSVRCPAEVIMQL